MILGGRRKHAAGLLRIINWLMLDAARQSPGKPSSSGLGFTSNHKRRLVRIRHPVEDRLYRARNAADKTEDPMSIASMTEVAIQRRTDIGTPHYVPKTYRQLAGAASGKETPDNATNTALKMIVTYIPTEVITLYLAIVAALQPPHGGGTIVAGTGQLLDA